MYLADDLLKGCPVAIKKSFLSGQAQAQKGFEIEAKLLARLDNPGLPKVLDYFITEKNVQTLVMDFIVGDTLEDILESGKYRVGCGLAYERVLDWTIQILDILRYLHNFEPPVVHRDIKPNNIKLTKEGKIVLLDFGLAKSSSVTVMGGMSGYSPIEQVQRTGTDQRSDIYSLGTSLFHLLTDRHPYTALERFRKVYEQSSNAEDSISNRRSLDPQVKVEDLNPHVPVAFSEIVATAMALEPKDRFQSSNEMKNAIFEARLSQKQTKEEFVDKSNSSEMKVDSGEDWIRAKPLIDDDEGSLGDWRQPYQQAEADATPLINDSFVPQKIGESSDGEHDLLEQQSRSTDDSKLMTTVSSYGFAAGGANRPQETVNPFEGFGLSASKVSAMRQQKNPKVRKRSLLALLILTPTIAIVGVTGLLAYKILSMTKLNIANTMIETSAAALTGTESKSVEVSIYLNENNWQPTPRNENYRFADYERFKFGVTSPRSGFLYIITSDSDDRVSLAYPKPSQLDNDIKASTLKLFPPAKSFHFDRSAPLKTTAYFAIVASRKEKLAIRIQNILGGGERKVESDDVSALISELEEISVDSGSNPSVKIFKLEKKGDGKAQ